MESNIILQGDALTKLKELPSESINCCMTSPPYWALRDYGSSVESIWDGDKNCEHEWIIGKPAVDSRIEKRSENRAGWERPSRQEFANRDIKSICPVCKKEFEAKPNQKFCSLDCLNTLSNEERQNTKQTSNFCQKCGAWKGQLGLEPTFDLYIKHLCDIFDEVKRVLRKDGTCWVNLGDTYASTPAGNKEIKFDGDGVYGRLMQRNTANGNMDVTPKPKDYGNLVEKSLVLIPFRFAIEMQNRGWILRNTIIWHKPNCMPSSVKDRFTADFEYLFFFVKSKKYWFETQYEPSLYKTSIPEQRNKRQQELIDKLYQIKKDIRDEKISYSGKSKDFSQYNNALANAKAYRTGLQVLQKQEQITNDELKFLQDYTQNHFSRPEGRNKRAVWSICPRPFKEAHFATYPEELCYTPIKAGCPEFVCNKCGKAREKIIIACGDNIGKGWHNHENDAQKGMCGRGGIPQGKYWREDKGYTSCSCNSGFSGGIVLDPFFGAGTTGLVALKQNKQFIGIELNPKYIKIANNRLLPFLSQTKLFVSQR